MAISDTNREFIDNLINYYISEAGAYKQIAEQYMPEIESVADAAFGIIAGCVYASFLETCRNQQIRPGLDDMTEFNKMIKARAAEIKKSIIGPTSAGGSNDAAQKPAESQDGPAKDRQQAEQSSNTDAQNARVSTDSNDAPPQDAMRADGQNNATKPNGE